MCVHPVFGLALGYVKGLNVSDHVAWALLALVSSGNAPAVRGDIDSARGRLVAAVAEQARLGRQGHAEWCGRRHVACDAAARQWNGPCLEWLTRFAKYDEFGPRIIHHLAGLPLVGTLPKSTKNPITVEDLRRLRVHRNRELAESVKTSLCVWGGGADLMRLTLEDALEGLCCFPVVLTEAILQSVTLCHRIPVRELRASGWRTRPVDDETEAGVNGATSTGESIVHDTIGRLAQAVISMVKMMPNRCRRGTSRRPNYRHVPFDDDHGDLAWLTSAWRGRVWVARHLGMMFGASSANCGVDPKKAYTLILLLDEAMESGTMDEDFAMKNAGRLSVIVTLSEGRVGRAFVKPFLRADLRRRRCWPMHACGGNSSFYFVIAEFILLMVNVVLLFVFGPTQQERSVG